MEEVDADRADMDVRSDGSDSTFVKSVGSSSSKDMGFTAHPGELGSRVGYILNSLYWFRLSFICKVYVHLLTFSQMMLSVIRI